TTRMERPRQPRRTKGKGWAFLFALAVQVGFLAVLVFSVQWQNRKPEPVTAELYAPPVKTPVVVEPPPPAPEPQPAPPPKPEPVVEKPDTRAADIALKAKQEQERKLREENERRAREAKEAEDKRKLEEKQKAERQQKDMAAMRLQAEREQQLRAQAEREIQARQAQQVADATARSRSEADWIRRIQAKVKGNVIVPSELSGNPEAIFEVVQLPTGEIIEATLVKSSGNRAYDDAVQRAIIKSSPLPRPDRSELFQRALTLKFRPQD
ncbi:MAG TPA: cell envelope integrity protein TolA, partial [Casimicrobiaceae bacterium]|nr:cell envelope integrity protein TolA [Casimicrobiaceae bacterium]